MSGLVLAALGPLLATAIAPCSPPVPRWLPASFDADRVYVDPTGSNGVTLRLYTDTGGGLVLARHAALRLGLHVAAAPAALAQELGPGALVASWPRLQPQATIPDPHASEIPVAAKVRELPGWPPQGDGILGAPWFAGRTWLWDYRRDRFGIEPPCWRAPASAHPVRLGFKTSLHGTRETNFPRIDVVVDGRILSMLLDTGAETFLSVRAAKRLADGAPRMRATSMISASVFTAWHRAHRDWPVINDAQVGTRASMIEVPDVQIAGFHTGPVWFTWRPDSNYHTFMSSMMDRRVEGSLGGNALKHFAMIVDYPHARAWFQAP